MAAAGRGRDGGLAADRNGVFLWRWSPGAGGGRCRSAVAAAGVSPFSGSSAAAPRGGGGLRGEQPLPGRAP